MNYPPSTLAQPRPRVGGALVACVVGFLAGELAATLFVQLASQLAHYPGGVSALSHATSPPWWANVASLAGLWLGFGGAAYYVATQCDLGLSWSLWRFRWSDLWFVVLGAACQGLIAVAYAPWHLKNLNQPVQHLFGASHGATYVLVGLLSVVVAPFMEEWFFRGVLFLALRRVWASSTSRVGLAVAVVTSGVLFALAHAELVQLAGLAFFGAVLALVVQRTGRLAPSYVTHLSFNLVALVALTLQRSGK